MKEDGVTLTELLVVISIIGILVVAMGFSFQGWMARYRVENETKELYTDVMEARTMSMTRNRMHFVVLSANNYQIYEDTNDNNAADPGSGDNPVPTFTNPKALRYGAGWVGTITFDTRGLSSSTVSIPLNHSSDVDPDYDCLMVSASRINMGKMSGGVCNAK